jgi:hypothetical protein
MVAMSKKNRNLPPGILNRENPYATAMDEHRTPISPRITMIEVFLRYRE